jgi:hypothetical protein
MRIWDLPVRKLCTPHLLGEHAELHAMWSVITGKKKGYVAHPETLRWKGKLRALYKVHEDIAAEMARRGFSHKSPLDRKFARGKAVQDEFVDTPAEQRKILRAKGCGCRV